MVKPDAVRKHDGRVDAFSPAVLARSIARAARDAGEQPNASAAEAFGHEMARALGEFLVKDYPKTPTTGDVRELTVRVLRESGHEGTAQAYADFARATAEFLWRLRLIDGLKAEGTPWDRRRLIESLRASGIARDPAGAIARGVERQLVALGEELISPGLVHGLTELSIHRRGLDARRYAARRIAASFATQVPRYDADGAETHPLPSDGPALAAFWTQAVHSEEVAAAARHGLLGLHPFPHTPTDDGTVPEASLALDPLKSDTTGRLDEWAAGRETTLYLRADDPDRAERIAERLAHFAAEAESGARTATRSGAFQRTASLRLATKTPDEGWAAQAARCAPALTLNVGGLLVREAIRDQQRVTVRLAHLVALAGQAHREREEYWGHSPVRGRRLPIVAAGLWNAAAWLARRPYDQPETDVPLRLFASTLASVLHGAVSTLRQETGMNLWLVGDCPHSAARHLWQGERAFFAQDGVKLDEHGAYALGLPMALGPGQGDLGERLDFMRVSAAMFDEPSAVHIEAPLGGEADPAHWRELFKALQGAGIARVLLRGGGSSRGMRHLARMIRGHLEGFPLFEQIG